MKNEIQIAQAVPIPLDQQQVYDEKLIDCISYSYSVKVISCIQIFFNVLTVFSNPYFIFQILFSMCGYYGAKKYNLCLTYIYFVHTWFSCLSEVFLLYFINTQDFPSYESRIFTNITFVLILLCNIYITKIVHRFSISLKKLTIEDINYIRQGTVSVRPIFVY
tara:strand:+ start:186 stop:674 length:489 start_codon:yes stop_codon:yes gene_type:complete